MTIMIAKSNWRKSYKDSGTSHPVRAGAKMRMRTEKILSIWLPSLVVTFFCHVPENDGQRQSSLLAISRSLGHPIKPNCDPKVPSGSLENIEHLKKLEPRGCFESLEYLIFCMTWWLAVIFVSKPSIVDFYFLGNKVQIDGGCNWLSEIRLSVGWVVFQFPFFANGKA